MPDQGACLAHRFGTANQHGVISNELPWAKSDGSLPDFTALRSEIDLLFGGEVVKQSRVRYRLKPSEKAAHNLNAAGYTTADVSGTFFDIDDPTCVFPFYFTNLGPWVTKAVVEQFVLNNCFLPDGTTRPTGVYVGVFIPRA